MLAHKQQYKSNVIPLQPVPPQPVLGQALRYTRNGRIYRGTFWGTITTEVKRYKVDGKHPVIYEYVIEPEAGQTGMKFHTVNEADVIWYGQTPVCGLCGDHGFLSIVGDNDTPCPVCNQSDGDWVF